MAKAAAAAERRLKRLILFFLECADARPVEFTHRLIVERAITARTLFIFMRGSIGQIAWVVTMHSSVIR
ncbi:MAG: hypothetical protein ABR584_04655 [Candidatus Baltobacteraceae bacterium]